LPEGLETGVFIAIYARLLAQRADAFQAPLLYGWFNRLPVKPEGKYGSTQRATDITATFPATVFDTIGAWIRVNF
jgi:hypothetical protein